MSDSTLPPPTVESPRLVSTADPAFHLIDSIKLDGLKIVCIGAGYVGGPTMAIIAQSAFVATKWRHNFAAICEMGNHPRFSC